MHIFSYALLAIALWFSIYRRREKSALSSSLRSSVVYIISFLFLAEYDSTSFIPLAGVVV